MSAPLPLGESKHAPRSDMVPVAKDLFFTLLGKTNVHPSADATTFKGRYFRSVWELGREVVGECFSDSWCVEPTAFFVRADLAKGRT